MMNRQEIDMKLISKAIKGEQQAFDSLYRYYYKSIYRYICLIVPNPSDAEDLTMITLEKAFLQLDKYVEVAKFQTWLFKIAKYTSFDFLESVKIRNEIRNTNPLEDGFYITREIDNPEQILINKQNSEILNEDVSKLQDKYRKVIELKYYDDLSIEEISLKLGLKYNMISQHIFRAKNMLSKMLIGKLTL